MARLELPKTDAIVVGSGPNGLAAAVRLAQSGWSVVVVEASATPGGGVCSAELTLPGFIHDVCSSVYPMAACSPFLSKLPLSEHGLEWVFPPAALAHPLDDGTAVLLWKSLEDTVAGLGCDAAAYKRVVGGLVPRWTDLVTDILAPTLIRIPHHPLLMANFGLRAIRSARGVALAAFKTERARALFAGLAAHSMLALEDTATVAAALAITVPAHVVGWPIVRGGAQQLTNSLVSYLKSLGGEVVTGCRVASLSDLPPVRAVLLDVTPRQLLAMAGSRPASRGWSAYRGKLLRYRYGMAAFKVDWALSRPVPWSAHECALAGTVHLGGTLDEISSSERHAADQRSYAAGLGANWTSENPFVLLVQPTLFDPSRAPAGKHTAWAYCHVPNGYAGDMTERIEKQVERFAPGFRDCILARSVRGPRELEQHNPNLIGGDIAGGAPSLKQLLFRPTASSYRTPLAGVYLCSSSTPPGPGVHGMCGYWAAERVMKDH